MVKVGYFRETNYILLEYKDKYAIELTICPMLNDLIPFQSDRHIGIVTLSPIPLTD